MYKVLAVSGYKPHELGIFNEKHEYLDYLKTAIRKKLRQLIEEYEIEWIITSGQPGVELWAAEAVISMKKEYPVKLATLAPFFEQEERWGEQTKILYEKVWSESDYTDFISKRKYEHSSQLRMKNQFIIDKSDAFLVLYDELTEGSPQYYISCAKKKQEAAGYPVIYLTPDEIDEVIREEQENSGWN